VPGAELADVPEPPLVPGTARVGVIECGVCGTDRDIVAGKYGRAPPGSSFLVLGHENLGVVREIGPEVPGLAPGDLVVATVRRGCGACRFCRANRSDFCETGRFTERGISGAHGYMAEEYVEAPEYLVKVPPALTRIAVLLEPLSVVEKAIFQGQRVLDRKEPTPGQPRTEPPTALVVGTGAVGMLAALVLTMRGYRITAIDRHGDDTPGAALLARLGARHVDAAVGIAALGDARFDLVLEAAGSAAVDLSLIERIGPNGVLILTGIPDQAELSGAVAAGRRLREMVLENQAIVGSVNANRTYFEAGIRDLTVVEERWPGASAAMITARRSWEEAPAVLSRPGVPGVKTVLTVGPADGRGA
jgi:glucose 1-dehydrogenase